MALADRLRQAMAGPPKVSPSELAAACGVKPPSVSDWLNGRTQRLRGHNLNRAASRLRVTPLWLDEGRGPMHPRDAAQFTPLYEDQLSARALRIMGRLLEAEQASTASDALYRILENALTLSLKDADRAPEPPGSEE